MALTAQKATQKVGKLLKELGRRRPDVDKRDRYFEGEQPLAYASDEFKKFHGSRFAGWSDNWCSVVGSAAAELTEFAAIRLGDDVTALDAEERSLLLDWQRLDGPALQAQGLLSSAVTSRSFALVWGDRDGEPLLTWEHASQAIVDYDPETRRAVAGLKAWRDDKREHATLYTDDEVWKFERDLSVSTDSGLILPYSLPGGWRLRETSEPNPMRNPLGVMPLVEFGNRPVLGKGPVSDIAGTMAMQDAINLMWAYLFGAADYASMPARVVMGQEPPKVPILNEQGQKVGEQTVDLEQLKKGRLLWLTGQGTTIGQWDSAKLDVFTEVIKVMVKHTASQTKTPVNYITGEMNNVNGEALTALRLPLVMKVRDGHKHLRSPQREVFRRIALVRGDAAVAEACRTADIGWTNPETSSDSQTSDAALKDKQIGWSAAGILERRYGMNQTEIDRELARRIDEANDPLLADLLRPPVAAGVGVG